MNIARNFLATAARLPHKAFLVSPEDTVYTYAEVLNRVQRLVSLLKQHDIKSGDRVILTFPTSVDYIATYLATLLHGCTAILVDYRSRPSHLDYVRTNCEAKAWIAPEERKEFSTVPGMILFPQDLLTYPEEPVLELTAHENPLALIMYTSGATGVPKGVCLTHANLQHTIRSITEWAYIEDNDRELTTLSLTHLFGLAHVHIYWTLGGTVYLEEKLQNIPHILNRIANHGITSFPGTPGGFKMIIDQFAEPFSRYAQHLKYIVINSAPMSEEYVLKLLELLPSTKVYMYYGLTEASRSSYICYNENRTKLKTVGKATPGAAICVGTPSSPLINEPGEILVAGPHLTQGYWGMDSAPFFINEWFRTGDLGSIDSDGFLTWIGRLKEQINVDGLKLTPLEVETVLLEHPEVKDCAAVGAPDEFTGEAVVAFVVPRGQHDKKLELDIRKFCKDRLEVYKIPRRVIFVDQIPRTDTGKTQRHLLKDQLNEKA